MKVLNAVFESSENICGVQRGVILQQRVHIQQVVLDGGTSDCPACFGPQLTHRHGGLHFRVLDVMGLIKNHTCPGNTHERRQVRSLITEIQEKHLSKFHIYKYLYTDLYFSNYFSNTVNTHIDLKYMTNTWKWRANYMISLKIFHVFFFHF